MLLADLVALAHAAAVVLLLTGGLLALRHPRMLWVHLPVLVAIGAVYLAGADCPLTTLELDLRARAGGDAYGGGFLGHYLLTPLGLDRSAPLTQVALPVVALLPNAAAVALLIRRRRATFTPFPSRNLQQRRRNTPTCEPPASPSSPEPLSSQV